VVVYSVFISDQRSRLGTTGIETLIISSGNANLIVHQSSWPRQCKPCCSDCPRRSCTFTLKVTPAPRMCPCSIIPACNDTVAASHHHDLCSTGTFEPELMMAIAERNGVTHKLPFTSVEGAREAYRCLD
jgi:hypothetical protein